MQMVGEDADGDGFERTALLHYRIGAPCTFDVADQQVARSVGQREREEEEPAFDFYAAIAGHLAGCPGRS